MTHFKHILFAAFICAATLNTTHAQIADPGFENWDSTGNEFFKNYMPAGWADFINQTCETEGKPWAITRTNDAHGGSYAIQLKNIALSFNNAATLMTKSGQEEDFNSKIPVTARHTKLEGYYKYSSPGNDTFKISVIMMKGEDFIGFSEYAQTVKSNTYTKFTIPIIYMAPAGTTPDSAIIMISAGSNDHFVEGTTLILDDVNFNLASGLNETGSELKADVNIWPNPAADIANLSIKGEMKGTVKVEVVNLLGQMIKQIEFEPGSREIESGIDLAGFPKGLLFFVISDEYGSKALRLVHQ